MVTRRSGLLRFLVFLAFPAALAHPQSSLPDPGSLVRQALDRLHAAQTAHTRFTCFELEHTVNTSPSGRVYADVVSLYEITWINDLPYHRLVEENGQPLTGKKLAAENARYNEAVANHRRLGADEQIRLHGATPISYGLRLDHVTDPDYRLTEIREETLYGRLAHVIRADPLPSTPEHPVLQQQFTLWITDTDPMLLRADFTYLDAERDFDPGLTGRYDWQLFDGYPVILGEGSKETARYGKGKKDRVIIVVDRSYTRYRQFSATVTLGPATAVPPSDPPADPPPRPKP